MSIGELLAGHAGLRISDPRQMTLELTAEHLADIAFHAADGKAISAAVQMVTGVAKSE